MPAGHLEYEDLQRPVYPTQQNAAMLGLVILTSSNPGDTVIDCYAGAGSALAEAVRLGHRFIGMDDSLESRSVIRTRMQDLGLACASERDFLSFVRPHPKRSPVSQP